MTSSLKTPDHRIQKARYASERFDCTCGAAVTAERDPINYEAHEPLVLAWAAHRKANGQDRTGMVKDAHGRWVRRPAA